MRTTVAILVLLVIGVGTVYTQSLPPPDVAQIAARPGAEPGDSAEGTDHRPVARSD